MDLPSVVQGVHQEYKSDDSVGRIVVRHYGPFALIAVVFSAMLGIWRWVDSWWLFLLIELFVILAIYRISYKKGEGNSFRWHAATPLIFVIAGSGLLIMVTGGVFRSVIAVLVAFSIGAHLRGYVKYQEAPNAMRALYCENVGWFMASFGVFALCVTLSGGLTFVRFPLIGVLGLVFLGTFLFTRHALEYSAISSRNRSHGRWALSLCITESMGVFLLLPSTPLVLAGLVLPLYAVLLELVRKPASFMKRSSQVLGASVVAGVWILLLSTARWP
ncbi:MAG: hypothetical protein WC659_00365 [Patescibacteria group bacterium]